MAFGKELKRLREASKFSAQQVADDLKISAHKLRKWEERDIDPTPSDQKRIEQSYKMSLEELVRLDKLPSVEIVKINLLNDTDQPGYGKDNEISALKQTIAAKDETIEVMRQQILLLGKIVIHNLNLPPEEETGKEILGRDVKKVIADNEKKSSVKPTTTFYKKK